MKETQIKRERDKVLELAREYKKKGFRILINPSCAELPQFMRDWNFQPDLIALSDSENLVFEVKTSETVRCVKDFARIADSIREHEGWDFVFVMTNPKKKSLHDIKRQIPNIKDAYKYLDKAVRLLEVDKHEEFKEAALLLAWSGVEAAFRYALFEVYGKKGEKNVLSLIRDSVMYGVVSGVDGKNLDSLLSLRNKVAHGYSGHEVTKNKVTNLIDITKRAISGLGRNQHLKNASNKLKKPRG
jgi:Holliday junction resolvase